MVSDWRLVRETLSPAVYVCAKSESLALSEGGRGDGMVPSLAKGIADHQEKRQR